MIKIEQMTVNRPNSPGSRPILTAINCSLAKDTVTLITGQTGSGKSTMLNALAGLIPIGSGSVSYDGQPLWSGKRMNDAVKFKMGILFQYPERQLFAESIRKEFIYSLRPLRLSKQEITNRISDAMNRMKLPERLLTESFFALSDGQKRKAAMATVIAVKPEWLLLDEPTAGIDPVSIPQLLETINAHKNDHGGGVVLVSHDLDTFLPIADRVLVMDKGTIAADMTPEELYRCPGILLQARIGLPASVEISEALLGQGLGLEGTPLTPEETAEGILLQIQRHAEVRVSAGQGPEPEPSSASASASEALLLFHAPLPRPGGHDYLEIPVLEAISPGPPQAPESVEGVPMPEQASAPRTTAAERLHPITKWMLYLLISGGILIQDQWLGIVVAAVITCICMYLSGVAYRTLLKPVKPFLLFILISALISGLTLSIGPDSMSWRHIDFSFSAALRTTRQLTVFLLIMLLGILFAVTTRGTVMQRGLEQAFSFLERLHLPVAPFTFSASLLLRFVPMLFAEIDRVSLITRARGKNHVKQGSIRLRDAHVFMIPLILSMMKHAEDLAFALEARGYKVKRISRSSFIKLRFHHLDFYAAMSGVLLFGILLLLHWWK